MAETRVSPSFTSSKLASGAIEDRIDVYDDRIRGWLLAPTRSLLGNAQWHFAALQLSLSYFEGWGQHRWGVDSRAQSKTIFVRAFADVFPTMKWNDIIPGDADSLLEMLYEQARCGAAHDGQARRRVLIGRLRGDALAFSAEKTTGAVSAILIDVPVFLEAIEVHFARYIAVLREPQNVVLRSAFTTTWERMNSGEPLHLPPGAFS
jgi:hypothetical protein